VSSNEKVKGAEVPIPEMILFSKGKARCVIHFDRNVNEIKGIYKKAALLHYKLMRWMINEYNSRRRTSIKSKIIAYEPSEQDMLRINDALMVNIRYYNKELPQSLSQVEFAKLMMERSSSKVWNEIEYIQNYVTVSKFLPENFFYSYNAPINKDNPKLPIDYLAEKSTKNLNAKAYRLCNTIGNYIAKTHGIVFA